MRSRIAWSLFGLSVLLAGAALALWVPTRSLEVSEVSGRRASELGFIVAFLAYTAVGSLIVSRRFGNRAGWIFLAVGLIFELGLLAQTYAVYALVYVSDPLPGGAWAGLLADLLPVAAFGCGTLLLLWYPTGRPLSRRWSPVAWLSVAAALVVALDEAFAPGTLSSVSGAAKPVEIRSALTASGGWAWPGFLLAGLLAIVSVVIRYRRADALERQQLRWFLAAVPIFVTTIFWVPGSDVPAALVALGLASLPVAAGIAIFRYRLYDLDLVLKRTLVYAVLTAGLAGLYFGIVLALQEVFSSFTSGSDLAVAISTLAVAGLFGPARRRVQRAVDRRFNRRHYDAQRTLEAFAARLRDEIDLRALQGELGTIVEDTMQPSHVSLWLRPSEERR
jgi:MFS family permease